MQNKHDANLLKILFSQFLENFIQYLGHIYPTTFH